MIKRKINPPLRYNLPYGFCRTEVFVSWWWLQGEVILCVKCACKADGTIMHMNAYCAGQERHHHLELTINTSRIEKECSLVYDRRWLWWRYAEMHTYRKRGDRSTKMICNPTREVIKHVETSLILGVYFTNKLSTSRYVPCQPYINAVLLPKSILLQ